MKIEVGKSYRTRDGRKATVLAEFPPEVTSERWTGYLSNVPLTWKGNGRFLSYEENGRDLVAEWSEPTPFEKCKIDCKPNQLTSDVAFRAGWNAALDYAASCVDRVYMGGTACERILEAMTDEIRKARV